MINMITDNIHDLSVWPRTGSKPAADIIQIRNLTGKETLSIFVRLKAGYTNKCITLDDHSLRPI